jgi:hypothetical protein
MKRIYLDQNIWMEFSRARLGSTGAKQEFRDAYLQIRGHPRPNRKYGHLGVSGLQIK